MALTDKLTSIADALRAKTGGTGKLTLDQIASGISGLDASGSGGSTAPTEAEKWIVGMYEKDGTAGSPTQDTHYMYYNKKLASGAVVTNNTSSSLKIGVAFFDSTDKVLSRSTYTVNAGASRTMTFPTDLTPTYLKIQVCKVLLGNYLYIINGQIAYDVAQNVTITGTEVS